MREAFMGLSKKEKVVFVLMLVLGYLSPVLGLVAFFIARKKTDKKILRYAPLAGAALALVVYLVDYMYLLWV